MSKVVKNFMGGNSYEINPLDTLKIVTASSIFGEPSYYRNGEFAAKTGNRCINDGNYSINFLLKNETVVLDNTYANMSTSKIMEKVIDDALDYDFSKTLDLAVKLRKEKNMRLNPQIIMVRAAVHSKRKEFTKQNPGKFSKINSLIMSRADEPSSQLAYWLYKNGDKNKIPTILKKSWANKFKELQSEEKSGRYYLSKYKNAEIGMVNTIRICHASGKLIDELMKTGTIKADEDNTTWENLRSQKKTWTEILDTINIPHMALLRNLRNIFAEIDTEQKCDEILDKLKSGVLKGKQFPFRYYKAYEIIQNNDDIYFKEKIMSALEDCMNISSNNMPKLHGKTMCLTDNSGSAWGSFNSQYGTVTVANIGNLSSVITARNSDEGYIGIFGDRLNTVKINNDDNILNTTQKIDQIGKGIGMSTENGIWLFFKDIIENKIWFDNIFIYSDMQASHGELYGTKNSMNEYAKKYGTNDRFIDVVKLIDEYRKTVNDKVNIFSVQTAGYNNVLTPENLPHTSVLYGWTGNELVYANEMNKIWDEIDK